jgi:hypothetical protein
MNLFYLRIDLGVPFSSLLLLFSGGAVTVLVSVLLVSDDLTAGAGVGDSTLAGTDLCTVAGSDLYTGAGSDLCTGAGSDLCTVAGSDLYTGAGSDLCTGAGSDLCTVAGSDLYTGAGSGFCTGAGTDLCTVAGSDLPAGASTVLLLTGASVEGFTAGVLPVTSVLVRVLSDTVDGVPRPAGALLLFPVMSSRVPTAAEGILLEGLSTVV